MPDEQTTSDTNAADNAPADPITPQRVAAIAQLALDGALEAPAGAEELVDALAALARERDELSNKLLRLAADYQNFQRRATSNEREARDNGVRGVVQAVLAIVDHFTLALGQNPTKATAGQVIDGVRAIHDELMRILSGFGVRPITPSVGDEFNPTLHAAVMQQSVEGVAPGAIAAVFAPGYQIGDRVVRHANVAVAPTA